MPVSGMSDHQILDMGKQFLEFEKEFNEILEKIRYSKRKR